MATVTSRNPPHVALLHGPGMGHLIPFLRLAVTLATHGCEITFIAIEPTVSAAETQHLSRLFSTFPQIHRLEFRPIPLSGAGAGDGADANPLYLQFQGISRSAHLLKPLLSSLLTNPSPISALITDMNLTAFITPIANELSLPNFIFWVSSASMLSLCVYFPTAAAAAARISGATSVAATALAEFRIPGIEPLPASLIPPQLWDSAHIFTTAFVNNGRALPEAAGIVVNSFDSLEPEPLSALRSGSVVNGLPTVFAVGPLEPFQFEVSDRRVIEWLDKQPAGSVVYVSFGSRTGPGREQVREIGLGLERSGLRFVWVVRFKAIDEEEREEEEIVEDGFVERVKDKGFIVMGWVDQGDILGHSAVGGFVSHCGWNSVSEAAWYGVPLLAWPQASDQRINAWVVERDGLGIFVKEWGWRGEKVVKADEFERWVKELMSSARVRMGGTHVREAARRAIGDGGISQKSLKDLMARWIE